MEPRKRDQTGSDSEDDTDWGTYSLRRKFCIVNDEDEPHKKRPKCFSKNALMARENRLKKKMYLESLERNVSKLTHDNRRLQRQVETQSDRIKELSREVRYVKNVLANSADISKILRSVHHNTDFPENPLGSDGDGYKSLLDDPELELLGIGGDLFRTDSVASFDTFGEHNYTAHSDAPEDVGVCLHVSKHRVSLEFCPKCNDAAADVWKDRDGEGTSSNGAH